MTRAARYAYVLLAWAFLIGVVLQVFFIGLALFVDADNFALHRDFGWGLHLAPILVLIAAALARAGRGHWLWTLALVVVVFIVPILAIMREGSPVIAALHPVGAIAAFWLAIVVARNSLTAFRAPWPTKADTLADRATA